MALEGGVDFTQPPLSFWGHSSVSETCEYQTERSLTRMSEWRDYLIEFEWSVPGVEEENTAVRLKETIVWTASSEFGTYRLCEQRRFRRACVSAQSRQNLRCSLIQAVNQEEPSDRKPDPWSLWMAGHAQLKFVMTECWKTQIRLTGLKISSTGRVFPVLHTVANSENFLFCELSACQRESICLQNLVEFIEVCTLSPMVTWKKEKLISRSNENFT